MNARLVHPPQSTLSTLRRASEDGRGIVTGDGCCYGGRAHPRPSRGGYALVLALVFIGISLLIMTSLLQWTSGNAVVTDRNNAYNRAVGAAEAATEKVLSQMAHDFIIQDYNLAKLPGYRSLVPTNDWAAEYEFSDGAGVANQTWVNSQSQMWTNLDSQFAGLYGLVYVCNTRANAKLRSTTYPDLAAAVRQDFQLASIPIFQFAIYYSMDLEINPGPSISMKVTGKVHGNADIYASPGYKLEFVDAVGAVGKIYHHRRPGDPSSSSGIPPVYDSLHQEKVSSLTLPIGTNNSPAAVQAILDPPPAGENPASPLGKQRYYNKAELLILVSDANVTVQVRNPGGFDNSPATVTWTNASFFISTNKVFFDQREGDYMKTTEIDVAKLLIWAASDFTVINKLGSGNPPNLVYVADNRSTTSTTNTAVRLVNTSTLPSSRGLTVATPHPLYVKGDFNAPDPKPASLVGDSITILSSAWDDTKSAGSLNGRNDAVNTTINAALLAGIVQTTNSGGRYSGGVENFPRLLEDWGGRTFTFNGSMVALFPSRYATNFWISSGTYYKSPMRTWAFDVSFLNWNKLPPGTPQVQKLVRGRWSVVAANSLN